MSKLSTKVRFFVLSCTPPAKQANVVARNKGYVSFLQEKNAERMAERLSARTPGTRFYVVRLMSGNFLPTAITAQSASY